MYAPCHFIYYCPIDYHTYNHVTATLKSLNYCNPSSWLPNDDRGHKVLLAAQQYSVDVHTNGRVKKSADQTKNI